MPGYQVELPVFTGPLDLLLQLVEKEKVSIYDIPIARIAEQYLASLERMREMEMDLDVASDFLVLAATLMSIKARELVPRPVGAFDGEDGDAAGDGMDEGDGDPRRELIRRLVEYKEIKKHAGELAHFLESSASLFPRGRREAVPAPAPGTDAPADGGKADAHALWEIYRRAVAREESRPRPYVAAGEAVTVVKRMGQVLAHLWREGVVSFDRLVSARKARAFVVVTFLAILELFRRGRVWLEQDSLYGSIQVGLRHRRASGKDGNKVE